MIIIQAETPIDGEGRMINDHVVARKDGELQTFSKNDVNLMDVSPNQMVSVAASLIPSLPAPAPCCFFAPIPSPPCPQARPVAHPRFRVPPEGVNTEV